MTPKTDSVAVLREFRAHASGNYRCSSTDACRTYYQQQIDALDAAIAALEAQASAPISEGPFGAFYTCPKCVGVGVVTEQQASAKREQQVEAFQAELAKLSTRISSLEAAPPLTMIGGTVVHPVLTEELNSRLRQIEERIERLEPKPGTVHLISSKDLR